MVDTHTDEMRSILEVALNIYDIEINTAVCYTESKMSAEDGKSRAGCDLARRIKDMRNDEKNTYRRRNCNEGRFPK